MAIKKLVFKLSACAWLGARIENACGSQWLAKYIAIIDVSSGFLSSTVMVVRYLFKQDEKLLFHDMYGIGGILIALLNANILIEPDGKIYRSIEYRVSSCVLL